LIRLGLGLETSRNAQLGHAEVVLLGGAGVARFGVALGAGHRALGRGHAAGVAAVAGEAHASDAEGENEAQAQRQGLQHGRSVSLANDGSKGGESSNGSHSP
jgi:hypothetical protein